MRDQDWTEIRLSLAASGKTPEQIERIIDRWYQICENAGITNDDTPQPKEKVAHD